MCFYLCKGNHCSDSQVDQLKKRVICLPVTLVARVSLLVTRHGFMWTPSIAMMNGTVADRTAIADSAMDVVWLMAQMMRRKDEVKFPLGWVVLRVRALSSS